MICAPTDAAPLRVLLFGTMQLLSAIDNVNLINSNIRISYIFICTPGRLRIIEYVFIFAQRQQYPRVSSLSRHHQYPRASSLFVIVNTLSSCYHSLACCLFLILLAAGRSSPQDAKFSTIG